MTIKKIFAQILFFTLFLSTAIPFGAVELARMETRTDLAVSEFNVSGQGVIVAILDRGIDWKSNDFRNDDGSTRIKYIFDLTDNSGANAPGNPYGVGTIYTEQQINNALGGGTQLATRDAVGHGTTTTGIAAGNGRNSENRKYRGFAPNASIISVKFTTEGAPAHGSQPAEAPFYNPDLLPQAIDFIRSKAQELGMPVVMLANFGSIGGPTDGTSKFARDIDAAVGPGKPGIIFVTGTGDDGGMPNHAGGTVTQGGTTTIEINKVTNGTLRFDLWYGGNDRFDVTIETPSGNFGPFPAPGNNNRTQLINSTITFYHNGANQVFYGALNGKREIFLDITGSPGLYKVKLDGATVTNGRYDATINPSNIFASNNRFLNNVVSGSIWDGATAFNNIAPNSYVQRTSWVDINGVTRTVNGQGNVGELWLGSSVGPTFDGRLGVDVSAPGDLVYTTYSPTSYFAFFPGNLIQGGGGLYGVQSAVSGAAPQVTGIIALMLEKNPRLDAAQVKAILQNSARMDSFTGQVPNTNWGYGKIDAHRAVQIAALVNQNPRFDFDGDGRDDISVFRPNNSIWYLKQSTNGFSTARFGAANDKLTPADYDGDGRADIAVWRESEHRFYILRSSDGTIREENFGLSGDTPITVGDWDGDGKADVSVYRPGAQSFFFYRGSNNNPNGNITYLPWGTSGDIPMNGDFDGDGKQDAAVFRPSNNTWYIRNSSDGSIRYASWGLATDKFVPADYDADGKTDLAVFRNGIWYILQSSNIQARYETFGLASDTLVPADYNGDGRTDIAVFRNGIWYIKQSNNGILTYTSFGLNGDKPLPNAYVP